MLPQRLIFLLLLIGLVPFVTMAQDYNPYQAIGKKAKILSASNGRYTEVFDYDSVQRIGTVLINIRTHRIVRLLPAGYLTGKGSDNSVSSRWYSIDPLAMKYPSFSPYNFAENNPIKNVDP